MHSYEACNMETRGNTYIGYPHDDTAMFFHRVKMLLLLLDATTCYCCSVHNLMLRLLLLLLLLMLLLLPVKPCGCPALSWVTANTACI